MPRRLRRKRRSGCAVFIALFVTLLGVGLAGYGFTIRWREAGAPPPQATDSPSPTPSPEPRQITVLGAGDVIAHPPVWQQAAADKSGPGYDFFPIFEGVSATISGADLALCHLETPIAAAGATPSGFPLFNAPPEVLDGIKKAGFDGCSTSSNHALDRGMDGVVRTLDAMDKAGLGHAGTARTAQEATVPKIYDVRGVKVGHLSYSYGFSPRRPSGKEWAANQIDPVAIKAEAAAARQAGAEVVVLSMHWGVELRHEPTPDQEKLAKELLDTPDIDLILGHHTHSVQAMEKLGDKWAVYSLGNQVARHSENWDKGREGVMARMTLTEESTGKWRVTKAEAIATWTELTPKVRIVELHTALSGTDLNNTTRQRYQATLDRIAGYLRLRDADAAGLVVVGVTATESPSPSPGQ